ncbi:MULTISPECIES: HD domain-containing protein [Eubacteriales]|uniref:HD domain-containing protein n=1 Tax=Eubacteriales TaxID=186802 RepID=UPI001105F231|nr:MULTISPECIES: HD domain-containing protein [Eubacteriales]
MSTVIDYLVELGLEGGKNYLVDKKEKAEIEKKLREYCSKQRRIHELSSLVDEIDFEGISEYLMTTLLEKVEKYLFGKKDERDVAYNTIINKVEEFEIKKSGKAVLFVKGSLNIIYNFYRNNIDKSVLLIAGEIEDTILDRMEEMNNHRVQVNQAEKKIVSKGKMLCYTPNRGNKKLEKIHDFVNKNYIKRGLGDELTLDEIEKYSNLFKEVVSVKKDEKTYNVTENNIFEFVKKAIIECKDKQDVIKIVGPDGTGKSSFLSILYTYLYKYCIDENICPFYINLHFYDSIISDDDYQGEITKNKINEDVRDIKEFIEEYPDLTYVFIIDGNENYFRTTLKAAKYFREFLDHITGHKKIVCIGEKTNIHSYRTRDYYYFIQLRAEYTFTFTPIYAYEKEKLKKFIELFLEIGENIKMKDSINRYLNYFDLDEIDLNILNVFRFCYERDMLKGVQSLSELYKKYCLSYLEDNCEFYDCAKMSYQYFMTNKKFLQNEIYSNIRKWNLIHQHKTTSNFLIAYYYIECFKRYDEDNNSAQLECVFTQDINVFIKSLINENEGTQRLILNKCKQVYEEGGILAQAQAVYMVGRLTNPGIITRALHWLNKKYEELDVKLKTKNIRQITEELKNIYFLFRCVNISLIYLGQKDKKEGYIELLLTTPIINEINRTFHLEYYGDILRTPDSPIYYYEDDGSAKIDKTYSKLYSRILKFLKASKGYRDFSFEINLLTLCSLVQVRMGKESLPNEYIQKLQSIIDESLNKKGNSFGIDFKAYLMMLKEDITDNAYSAYHLYEKLYGIKKIERNGWKKGIKNNAIEHPYENVAEHIYFTWMLGMLYLPDNPPEGAEYKYYDKQKILDIILIHDWAEIDVGDAVPEEDTEEHRELEDLKMRILLMHDTYNEVGNMSQYKTMWNLYGKNKTDINVKLAYEMDKIQAIYQFYLYSNEGAEFTDEKRENWINEKNKITSSVGQKILQELVLDKYEK